MTHQIFTADGIEHYRGVRLPLLCAALALSACSGGGPGDGNIIPPPPPPPPAAPPLIMTPVAGQGQTTDWGHGTPVPPSVIVVDSNGHPVSGITVTFTAGALSGSLTGATQVTGASGNATVGAWNPGLPVGPKTLTATAPGASSVEFIATVVDVAQVSKYSGFDQSAPAGTVALDPPSIKVTTTGQVGSGILVGAVVRFTVVSGGGTVTGDSTRTDNYGYARVGSWTLGPLPGANKLQATVVYPGAPVTTFTATGTP